MLSVTPSCIFATTLMWQSGKVALWRQVGCLAIVKAF